MVCACAAPEEIPATPIADIDAAIAKLEQKKAAWVGVTTDERARMLQECKRECLSVARKAALEAVNAHGSYGNGIGEEL